jgi:hypothetical protein
MNLKPKIESSSSFFYFQALGSRRCQRGFDRVNLHRPTVAALTTALTTPTGLLMRLTANTALTPFLKTPRELPSPPPPPLPPLRPSASPTTDSAGGDLSAPDSSREKRTL